MRYMLLLVLLVFVENAFAQIRYMDEDANGNWVWKEVVEYDSSLLDPKQIIDNINQWLDRKKALFNATAVGDLAGFRIENNLIDKGDGYLRGYLQGQIERTALNSYVVRIYIDVEAREGRYRVVFSEMTILASWALGTIIVPSAPSIFTRKEIAETFKKKKGPGCLDETIARLIAEITADSQRIKSSTQSSEDW
jgi:hypothetical protein